MESDRAFPCGRSWGTQTQWASARLQDISRKQRHPGIPSGTLGEWWEIRVGPQVKKA